MKKIKTNTLFSLLISFGFLLSGCSSTTVKKPTEQATQYREGLHYKHIKPEQPYQADKGKVEVVEMFFYACPHCYELEEKVTTWVKAHKDSVQLKRMPAIVGPTWVSQAKAYYIAEELGILSETHKKFFDSIHKQGQEYYNDYTIQKFFMEQGVSQQAYYKASHSAVVAEKLSQARIMTVKYGLRGVPAFIVNGKYKTAPFYTRNYDDMFQVLDQLVDNEIAKQTNEK